MKTILQFILSLVLLFNTVLLKGQENTFVEKLKIETDIQLFTTDKLQQIYIVNTDNEIIKYSSVGIEQFRYNDNAYGTVTHIDATNPLQIVVYYADFLQVVVLDRTLSPTSTYSLLDANFTQVPAIGISNSNTMWLYDELDFRLKKINGNGEVIRQSDNLALFFPQELHPTLLIERNNRIYLNEPSLGILVFDVFGNYLKTIEIKDLQQFQIQNNQVFYIQNGQLKAFHLQAFSTATKVLPIEEIKAFRIEKDRLFVQVKKGVKVYVIPSP